MNLWKIIGHLPGSSAGLRHKASSGAIRTSKLPFGTRSACPVLNTFLTPPCRCCTTLLTTNSLLKDAHLKKPQILGLALSAVCIAASPALLSPSAFAQAVSVNGGSIQGTITDPTGAVVRRGNDSPLRGTDTGFKKDLTTDKGGLYAVGPLNPGNYNITVDRTGVSDPERVDGRSHGHFDPGAASS